MNIREAFAPLHDPALVPQRHKRDWFTEGKNPPWWGYATEAGESVSEASALRVVTAWRCVNLLASTVGTLPKLIYRNLDRGKERSQFHPLYRLLHDQPNQMMTASTLFEAVVHHLLVYGNAFGFIDRSMRVGSDPDGIYLMCPDRVSVKYDDRSARYYYMPPGTGDRYEVDRSEILHWRGLTYDGVMGLAPIQHCKLTLGLSIAAEKYGARFFGNNSHPGGILAKDDLHDDERDAMKATIEEGYRGNNQLRFMVMNGEWKYTPIGIPPEQAQFLQTRVKQDADVCRIFGVPPWLVGVPVEGSKPYANVEQEMINFAKLTLRQLLVRIEEPINAALFPRDPVRGREYFFEFLVDGLMRGDGVSRFKQYEVGIRSRILSPNEVRELENLSPYEGGDNYDGIKSPAPVPAKEEE